MPIFLLTNATCIITMAIGAAMFMKVRENMLELYTESEMQEISI
jgi:hypothetical protein